MSDWNVQEDVCGGYEDKHNAVLVTCHPGYDENLKNRNSLCFP